MMRLSMPTKPFDIKTPLGVVFTVRPCSTPIIEMAMAKSRRIIGEIEQGISDLSMVGHDADSLRKMIKDPDYCDGIAQFAYAHALAMAGVVSWKGKGVEEDDGTVAEITSDNMRDVMLHPAIARTFVAKYTEIPTELLAEGNA